MNYIKYAQDNQKRLGYKILSINSSILTIKCLKCGAIKKLQLKSLYKNKNTAIHNQFCSQYYLNIAKKEIGLKNAKIFHDFYRHSHERCCNSNNKDYKYYKGKFQFNDFCDFFKCCYDIYKNALKTYYAKELTIDRIDGSKGYEKGNIRFIPMFMNLQNKACVKPVKMTNINTGQVIQAVSIGELARKYKNVSYASSLHRALNRDGIYKKEWKIEYIET